MNESFPLSLLIFSFHLFQIFMRDQAVKTEENKMKTDQVKQRWQRTLEVSKAELWLKGHWFQFQSTRKNMERENENGKTLTLPLSTNSVPSGKTLNNSQVKLLGGCQ